LPRKRVKHRIVHGAHGSLKVSLPRSSRVRLRQSASSGNKVVGHRQLAIF
jgi:hypothetical protein